MENYSEVIKVCLYGIVAIVFIGGGIYIIIYNWLEDEEKIVKKQKHQMAMSELHHAEPGKVFVDVRNTRCPACDERLRMVTAPTKQKCDICKIVYTINPSTGEVVSQFRSFVK